MAKKSSELNALLLGIKGNVMITDRRFWLDLTGF